MKQKTITRTIAMILLLSFCTVTTFAATEKTLFFDKEDGKLYYDDENSQNIDAFLDFQNMSMNQTYEDSLKIKNEADKTYQLYFQILPKEGLSKSALKLLSAIEMKIYNDGVLLYEGLADGITKTSAKLNAEQMTSIGDFAPGQEATLKVEIKLNVDDTTKTQKRYYVKSAYQQWEAADFAEAQEPNFYSSQAEASAAAQKLGENEISYQEESMFNDEVTREIQGMMANTLWKFYGVNQDVETPTTPTTPTTPATPTTPSPSEILPINPPNTGVQDGGILAIVLVAIASLGAIIFLGKRKERII